MQREASVTDDDGSKKKKDVFSGNGGVRIDEKTGGNNLRKGSQTVPATE
jgi:hypothetical protein